MFKKDEQMLSKKYKYFLPICTYGIGDLFNILLYPEWQILNRMNTLYLDYGNELDIKLYLKLRLYKNSGELFQAFPYISSIEYEVAVEDVSKYNWNDSINSINNNQTKINSLAEKYKQDGYKQISREWLIENVKIECSKNTIFQDIDNEVELKFKYSLSEAIYSKKLIIIHPFSGMKKRDCFTYEMLNAISYIFKEHTILLLGSNSYPEIQEKGIEKIDNTKLPSNMTNLIDKTNIRLTYWLIQNCNAFIGTHSSLLNIAWFNNIKSLCIYPEYLSYITNSISSTPENPSREIGNYTSDILHSYGFRNGITQPFAINNDLTYDIDEFNKALERLI
jgi:hypothetical protein